MNLSMVRRWWKALRGRHSGWPLDADPADMGTAFALDASLLPGESEPAAADTLPSFASFSWEERLARRGL